MPSGPADPPARTCNLSDGLPRCCSGSRCVRTGPARNVNLRPSQGFPAKPFHEQAPIFAVQLRHSPCAGAVRTGRAPSVNLQLVSRPPKVPFWEKAPSGSAQPGFAVQLPQRPGWCHQERPSPECKPSTSCETFPARPYRMAAQRAPRRLPGDAVSRAGSHGTSAGERRKDRLFSWTLPWPAQSGLAQLGM